MAGGAVFMQQRLALLKYSPLIFRYNLNVQVSTHINQSKSQKSSTEPGAFGNALNPPCHSIFSFLRAGRGSLLKMVRFPGRRRKRDEAACNTTEREGRELSRGVKIPKALREENKDRMERASKVEEQLGRCEGALPGKPDIEGGGGGMFKWKHIKGKVGFQSSSKMMSISQIIAFHNKPVKTAQKKETAVDGGLLVCLSPGAVSVSVVSFVSASSIPILTCCRRLSSKVAQDVGVEVS